MTIYCLNKMSHFVKRDIHSVWVPGDLAPGLEWLEREADNLPPSSAEVKNGWSYTSSPPYIFMA